MAHQNDLTNYLNDLTGEILELGKAAKNLAISTDDAFEKGRQMAFYEVLSLVRQQAAAFGIEDVVVALENVNLERVLLSTE